MALYSPVDLASEIAIKVTIVKEWIDANPGGTAQECATALTVPIEAVYFAVDQLLGYEDLPTTGAEYQARRRKPQ